MERNAFLAVMTSSATSRGVADDEIDRRLGTGSAADPRP